MDLAVLTADSMISSDADGDPDTHSPKRRRLEPSLNGHSNTEQASQRTIEASEKRQLQSAFQLIDCHGINDFAFPFLGVKATTLRKMLASDAPLTFAELEAAVQCAFDISTARLDDLPPLPFNPNEPQYKGAVRRTDEETALVQEIGETRQDMMDASSTRLEQLREWHRRATSLAAGSLRGIQGRGSVPPVGSTRHGPIDTSMPSVDKRIVLHRALAGAYDVFTSANTAHLSKEALQSLKRLSDTDIIVEAALPAAASLRLPSSKLAVYATPEAQPAVKSGKVGRIAQEAPSGVEHLSYGCFESFAPTYDSSQSALPHATSVKVQLDRERGQGLVQTPLALSRLPSDPAMSEHAALAAEITRLPAARLARTGALLRRLQIAQFNRIKAVPLIEAPAPPEIHDAHLLHQELAQLISEGRITKGSVGTEDLVALRALHPGATRPGFSGILDARSLKAVREGVLVSLPPAK